MRRSSVLPLLALATCFLGFAVPTASAQPAARTRVAMSTTERDLASSAEQGLHTFLVFYRQKDARTDAMVAALKRHLADRDQAAISYVAVTDPAQKALVAKYGVSRAPMPLTMALAPNGAITAMFPGSIDDAKFAAAFVTPAEADSLQALQQRKLVFITISTGRSASPQAAIQGFSNDPDFSNRMQVIALDANDPTEREFLDDLKIVPGDPQTPAIIVLAPPGVLVGRFAAGTSKSEITAALVAANKCCDDPNCKHGAHK